MGEWLPAVAAAVVLVVAVVRRKKELFSFGGNSCEFQGQIRVVHVHLLLDIYLRLNFILYRRHVYIIQLSL